MISPEAPKAGPKVGSLECGNCGICPLAGGGCPRRSGVRTFEGSVSQLGKLVTGIADIITNDGRLREGRFILDLLIYREAIGPVSTEPSKKTCSLCREGNTNACTHLQVA